MRLTILLAADETNPYRTQMMQKMIDEGYYVVLVSDSKQAIHYLKNNGNISLVVLDSTNFQGEPRAFYEAVYHVCNAPILVITEQIGTSTELKIWESDVDDCLCRPFDDRILMARIRNLLKRTTVNDLDEIVLDSFRISNAEHTVEVDGKDVSLTPKEFDLLYYLAQNQNLALSRYQILNCVWEPGYIGDERIVDSHIKALRSKLGWVGAHIVTVRSVGYKFLWEHNVPIGLVTVG